MMGWESSIDVRDSGVCKTSQVPTNDFSPRQIIGPLRLGHGQRGLAALRDEFCRESLRVQTRGT
jgi:hypothetical protein